MTVKAALEQAMTKTVKTALEQTMTLTVKTALEQALTMTVKIAVEQAVTMTVSWHFEPSQPQRVTSLLKTMFNLAPIYSARKSSNHKLSINHKNSHDTNLHKTKHTQTSDKKFEELVPSVSPRLKKHIRLGHAGIVSIRRFINTRF